MFLKKSPADFVGKWYPHIGNCNKCEYETKHRIGKIGFYLARSYNIQMLLSKRFPSCLVNTVKALSSPRGTYLMLDTPQGGLIREEGLFKKLDEKDIYDSLISLLPHILEIQHTILEVKYKFDRVYPKRHQN